MQSVSGGGHWGGGLWISARDLARFGLLFQRDGVWGGERILSAAWIDAMTTPADIRPNYGYMWWLNTDRGMWPAAPETSFAALGFGGNVVWVDREHDLVIVTRWLDDRVLDAFLKLVLGAIREGAA